MADQDFQEKTEQPTPKRLEEARQKGNVPRSMEVNSAMVMLAGIGLLYAGGSLLMERMTAVYYAILTGGYTAVLSHDTIVAYFVEGLTTIGLPLFLFMTGILVTGLAANIFQVGFLLTAEPLLPKAEKLNPLNGFKKVLFSKRSMEELIKNLLKLTLVVVISYFAFTSFQNQFPILLDQSVGQIFSFMTGAAMEIALKITAAMIFIAVADYAFQRYDHIQNLKMSKQEVKDEQKQTEGDPKVKSRIRSLQMQMSRNRMIGAVPEADVVITNPTHYAVALRYDPAEMASPRVVAKGQNLIALKIREIAEEHNIPIVEDPPLAQALYKAVDVDQEVPAHFFQALAEVLAYVYKLKGKRIN